MVWVFEYFFQWAVDFRKTRRLNRNLGNWLSDHFLLLRQNTHATTPATSNSGQIRIKNSNTS